MRASLTDEQKRAILEALDADPEWAFDVLSHLLKQREQVEAFRRWIGIDALENAVRELAEAQSRTEQQVRELAEAQSRTEQQVRELAEAQSRTEQQVRELAEAQSRTEQQVRELAEAQGRLAEAQSRTEQQVRELAEAQSRTEQQVQELAETQKALVEAQSRTEEQVKILTHRIGVLSEILGPTWEEEARESVIFLLKKAGVRLLTPFMPYDPDEWDGIAEAEWQGRTIQVCMEAKVSAGAGRIQDFANKAKRQALKTDMEVMPIFCAMRLYAGAREEAQKQRIVIVGLRVIRNEIVPQLFTIRPEDAYR